MSDIHDIRATIRDAIAARRWTVSAIEEHCGISRRAAHLAQRGDWAQLSANNLAKLLRGLDLEIVQK